MSRATSSQLAELPTPKVTSANASIVQSGTVPKTAITAAHMNFFMVSDQGTLAGSGHAQLLQILDQARSSRQRFNRTINFLDDAFRIYVVGPSFSHSDGIQHPIRIAHLSTWIRQDGKTRLILLSKSPVVFNRVRACHEINDIVLTNLSVTVTQRLAFERSAAGIRLREKCDHHVFTQKVGKSMFVAVRSGQCPIWRHIANFKRRRRRCTKQ